MKTSDILLIGGIAAAAYWFFFMREANGYSGGGGTALPDPSGRGTWNKDVAKTGLPDIMTGQSNYYRDVPAQQSAQLPVTAQQLGINVARYVYGNEPISGVSIAKAVYSGGFGVPSKPADIMTGMSVRQDQPFKQGVVTKPVGFV